MDKFKIIDNMLTLAFIARKNILIKMLNVGKSFRMK